MDGRWRWSACCVSGRHDEFFETIRGDPEPEATNLHSASLSAFAAYHLGRPDPHPFCPKPLEQVRVVDRYTRPGADADFLRELISEASRVNAVWEPRGVTTQRGFQTGGNLFAHGYPALARLGRDLIEELQRYRAALRPASMTLATRWPMNMRLHGWYVRLLTGGHQYFHNHPFGWMSGTVYLQMPQVGGGGRGRHRVRAGKRRLPAALGQASAHAAAPAEARPGRLVSLVAVSPDDSLQLRRRAAVHCLRPAAGVTGRLPA